MITRQHVLAIEQTTGRNIPLRRKFNSQRLKAGGDVPGTKSNWDTYLNSLQITSDIKFEENDALVVIDMQRDFVPNSHDENSPSTFGVAGGDTIVPLIAHLITTFLSNDRGYVIATRDYHPANHASFIKQKGPFPSHCVQGTPGAEIVPQIARALTTSGLGTEPMELHPRARITFKGFDPSTDSFGGAKYKDKNRSVCTDFCTERSGSFVLPASAHKVIDQTDVGLGIMPLTGNINAPPDIQFSQLEMDPRRLENLDIVKNANTIFVVGLALDFCVVDTAINLSQTHDNVCIIVDLCRPAFVDAPENLVKLLNGCKVKLTVLINIQNLPELNEKYHNYFTSK